MSQEEIRQAFINEKRNSLITNIRNLDRILKYKQNPTVLHEKGRSLLSLADIENPEENRNKALDCFNAVLSKNPYDVSTLIDRARLYAVMNDYENCLKDSEMMKSIPLDMLDGVTKIYVEDSISKLKEDLIKINKELIGTNLTEKEDNIKTINPEDKEILCDYNLIRKMQQRSISSGSVRLWSKWKHYKGEEYIVVGFVTAVPTTELLVCHINTNQEKALLFPWVAPISEWERKLIYNGEEVKVFTPIK